VRVAALGIAALMSYASPLRWASSEWDRTRFLEEPNGELTAGRISRRCPQSGPLVPEQRISPDKWDEQVLRIGETVSHEKDGAAPHRGSSLQTVKS
jgi:hypothetical protein